MHADMAQGVADLRLNSGRAEGSMIVAMLVALALAILGRVLMSRAITRPIAQLSGLAERMAKGDLTAATASVAEEGRNDVAALQRSFQRMDDRPQTIVGQLKTGISQLSTSTAEIAGAAQ